MHANELLHNLLSPVMSQKRLVTLDLLVDGALKTKKVSVTDLGRGIEGKMQERSAIRRSDRFIGNKQLAKEKDSIYKKITSYLILENKNPRIIIDWSPLPNGKLYVLRAALITIGRALTLYEKVYTEKQQNSPRVQSKFLTELSKLLPANCCPIIITDAGFYAP